MEPLSLAELMGVLHCEIRLLPCSQCLVFVVGHKLRSKWWRLVRRFPVVPQRHCVSPVEAGGQGMKWSGCRGGLALLVVPS
jgi:hypothetical protein